MIPFAIPAILKRFLPHILIVGAVLFGVWYIGHLGEKRAEDRLERERLTQAIIMERTVRRIESGLSQSIAAIDMNTAAQITEIQRVDRTVIQPTIERIIRDAPRLSAPDCALPVELRDAINTARQLSGSAGPASELTIPLSGPEPAQ